MNAIDYIEGFFWTLTYIIIAVTGFINKNEKRICMSTVSLCINFSWETASIIYSCIKDLHIFDQSFFIRFSWFFFDIFIIWCYLEKNDFFCRKKRILFPYLLGFVILTPVFFYCFYYTKFGMPITAFIIDAHMEMLFWFHRKRFDPSNRLLIGITKILGDFFAGVYNGASHPLVIVLAVTAFFFDVLYIMFAIKEKKLNPNINDNFIRNKKALEKKIKLLLLGEKNFQKKRVYKKKKKRKKHIK